MDFHLLHHAVSFAPTLNTLDLHHKSRNRAWEATKIRGVSRKWGIQSTTADDDGWLAIHWCSRADVANSVDVMDSGRSSASYQCYLIWHIHFRGVNRNVSAVESADKSIDSDLREQLALSPPLCVGSTNRCPTDDKPLMMVTYAIHSQDEWMDKMLGSRDNRRWRDAKTSLRAWLKDGV